MNLNRKNFICTNNPLPVLTFVVSLENQLSTNVTVMADDNVINNILIILICKETL